MIIKLKSNSSRKLRRALLANAAFSAISGGLIVFAEPLVLTLLGLENIGIAPIGIFLLVFAIYLVWMSGRENLRGVLVSGVIVGDWAWVLASVALLAFSGGLFSTLGVVLIIDIAVVVAVFAIMQTRGLKQATAQVG